MVIEKSLETHEAAKQSTQKLPEVTGLENGNMFKIAKNAAKRDKVKI